MAAMEAEAEAAAQAEAEAMMMEEANAQAAEADQAQYFEAMAEEQDRERRGRRKLLYISGPFSDDDNIHGVERNILLASEAALQGWRQGFAVICPHKNTAGFQHATDIPHEVWIEGDLEILKHCDAICMLPGWQNSKGALQEKIFASEKGLEILYYLNGVIVGNHPSGMDIVWGNIE